MASDATESKINRDDVASSVTDVELPALVWQVDSAHGAFGFNQAWERLTGVTGDRLSLDRWFDYIHPIDRAQLAFLRDPSLAEPGRSLDIRIRDASGQYRWFLLSCGPANRQKVRALVALSIDDRKSVELNTDHELADVRSLVDHAPTMMWRTTADGEMDYANERYLKAWGKTLEQVMGWGWKDSVHPDDRQGIVDYWDKHRFSDGDGMYEFRAGNPDTGYRWCLSVCSARLNDEGNVHQWYGATFDIEDRKQAT